MINPSPIAILSCEFVNISRDLQSFTLLFLKMYHLLKLGNACKCNYKDLILMHLRFCDRFKFIFKGIVQQINNVNSNTRSACYLLSKYNFS